MTERAPRIDFRSDTVTRPTQKMREAMASALVGDDYYRDDPTVHALERHAAELFGKEAALLTTSGTQSNLIAVMAQCGRGEAYIVGDQSHSYLRELGGAAMVGAVQPQVVPNAADGRLPLGAIEAALYPASILFAPVTLIALENTINGRILPLDYLSAVQALANARGLRMHLDGARVFNAAVALDVPVREIASRFDTVSVCLSKGLGAPVGSILAGDAEVIEAARRHRQLLGGGMRQAGILAAAGLYALQHHIARLADDHRRAAALAAMLAKVPGVAVDPPQTNMVFTTVAPETAARFSAHLAQNGVAVTGTPERQRFVTHIDIDETHMCETERLLAAF